MAMPAVWGGHGWPGLLCGEGMGGHACCVGRAWVARPAVWGGHGWPCLLCGEGMGGQACCVGRALVARPAVWGGHGWPGLLCLSQSHSAYNSTNSVHLMSRMASWCIMHISPTSPLHHHFLSLLRLPSPSSKPKASHGSAVDKRLAFLDPEALVVNDAVAGKLQHFARLPPQSDVNEWLATNCKPPVGRWGGGGGGGGSGRVVWGGGLPPALGDFSLWHSTLISWCVRTIGSLCIPACTE